MNDTPHIPEASYEERRRALSATARTMLLQTASERFTTCQQLYDDIRGHEREILREMVQAGKEYNQSAGDRHEQLVFTGAGAEFFREVILPTLPPRAGVAWVKSCVAIARKFPEGITDQTELRPLRNMLQLCLAGETTVRNLETERPPRNIFCDVLRAAIRASSAMRKLINETPLEKWTPAAARDFMKEWQPVVEFYERVRSLTETK